MRGIVYDAGALIAAERDDRALWADHRMRLEEGTIPVAPAAVVARPAGHRARSSFVVCSVGVTLKGRQLSPPCAASCQEDAKTN
ncbi:MAG: hypothetical protein ACRDRG_20870 [Pseudonocardiaceae bacterium]